MNIRHADKSDASRITEMIVTNYRKNFFPIFKNAAFYFGEIEIINNKQIAYVRTNDWKKSLW